MPAERRPLPGGVVTGHIGRLALAAADPARHGRGMDAAVARSMWIAGEPFHAVTYFAPAVRTACEEAGLRGFWRGYFATRAAPLGPVGPEAVGALFYNFAPAMVRRAVPGVWSITPPPVAWAARLSGVDTALRAVLGDEVAAGTGETATLARSAAEACPLEGRGLGAAYAAMPWPDEPHLVLWQAATVLREARGDGHNAALLVAGVDGCAAHVLMAAAGATPRELTQPNRGWTDDEWAAAVEDLRVRGLLDGDGRLTDRGRQLRQEVEATTDRLALAPWEALGADRTEQLRVALGALSGRVIDAGVVPVPNPMGVPWP